MYRQRKLTDTPPVSVPPPTEFTMFSPPRILRAATACFFSLLFATHCGTAHAACPADFAGKSCNGGTGSNICSFTSTSVTCSFNDIAGTQGAEGTFYSTSCTAFRGFGTDSTGEMFCCEYTGLVDACNDYTTPPTESFTGTNYSDTIKLQFGALGLGAASPVVYGLAGDDDIQGSFVLALNYFEVLYGDDGADTIRGEAGVDEIHGGAGADIIWGGDDDDEIYGDAGDDHIKGEDGDDYLDGGADDDQVCGGNANDQIYGGLGADTLSSGPGGVGAQIVDGGLGTNHCGYYGWATVTNCVSDTITSCPW